MRSLDKKMEKNKKGVLTGARVWGWTGREALAGPGVYFCSDDCKEKRRMIEKGSLMVSYYKSHLKKRG